MVHTKYPYLFSFSALYCIYLYSYNNYICTATTLHISVHAVHSLLILHSHIILLLIHCTYLYLNLYYSKPPSVNQLYTTIYIALYFLSCLCTACLYVVYHITLFCFFLHFWLDTNCILLSLYLYSVQ